jgi:PAS domain S-box-containing protein
MSDRKRILVFSILIMAGGMFCAAAVTITILYRTAFEEERRHLVEIARGQARLMEAVARFDATHSQAAHPNGATGATLSQIADAHQHYPGFGETGEFVVARRDGDQIVFLFPYRHGDGGDPDPVPWESELAGAMHLALSGEAGTLIGLDYRGERVLAAHEPVAALNFGVVAKTDLAEIHAPFITAGVVAGGVTIVLVLVGAGLTLRITDPLIRRLGLFQRFAEESGHGLAMADLNRRVTYVNPALCRMLGVERPEDVLGKTFDPFYSEEARRRVNEKIIRTVLEEGQWKGELAQLSKKGEVSQTLENIFLIRDEKGDPLCLANVITDISERKRAEQERESLIGLLEESNATLDHLNERLTQSNRELQDFAYVASHDLQEPLRKVQAFGERLKVKYEDALDDQGHDYIGRMQNAAERMQTLINDLLSFSRISTKAQPFTPVGLGKVIEGVLSDLETHIEELGARVEVGDLPTLDADPLQMRQLLQNLIGNALKFHRRDEPPVVKVRGDLLDSGGQQSGGLPLGKQLCQITVEDNGIGFEQKHADRIFGFFQRLHGRSAYEGTGIGLAICRKIVDRHGGSITAESSPGQGAKFIVALPIKQPKGEPEQCQTSDNQSRS